MMDKFSEILSELRNVVLGERHLLDSVLPPVLFFILVQTAGFQAGLWGALALAVVTVLWRLWRRQAVAAALGGVVGVLLALALVQLLARAEGFFLPGIIMGSLTVLLALLSLAAGRPLVAWSSHLTRRWPRAWYWHPQVRPAYAEVTWAWLLFFLLRLLLQLRLFQQGEAEALAGLNLLLGWPALLLLLVLSYLYGTWRLRRLAGPSVAEFLAGAEPPWESQQQGF